MIKPDDVRPRYAQSRKVEQEMVELERACDDAIRASDASEQWPAKVARMRQPMSVEAIVAVAAMYVLAGWRVNRETCESGCYMEIDRP